MTARRDERIQIALGLFIPYGLCALRVLLTASQLVEPDCDSYSSPKSMHKKALLCEAVISMVPRGNPEAPFISVTYIKI